MFEQLFYIILRHINVTNPDQHKYVIATNKNVACDLAFQSLYQKEGWRIASCTLLSSDVIIEKPKETYSSKRDKWALG